jgi:hypothetical protein
MIFCLLYLLYFYYLSYATYQEFVYHNTGFSIFLLVPIDLIFICVLVWAIPKIPYWATNRCPKHKIKNSLIWEGVDTNLHLCPMCYNPSLVNPNNSINRHLGL